MGFLRPFEADKHPRGYAGRFTGGTGVAGSLKTKLHARPRPEVKKIAHAVSPSAYRPRTGMTIATGSMQTTGD